MAPQPTTFFPMDVTSPLMDEKRAGAHLDRQDPAALKAYVEKHMARYGSKNLLVKRWEVPRQRAEKGLKARIGVGALIWDHEMNGRVLLVRHHPRTGWDPEKWFTPGGVIEDGETPEDALAREVMEEVGLEIEVLSLSMVNNEVLVNGDIEASTYFFQFEVKAKKGTPRPGEGEIQEVRWFDHLPKDMAFRDDYIEVFKARTEYLRRKQKR
jgi:8-oxo-dGTP diphosphatase